MNDTDLDKLLDDIYQCGRTDATLNVDDYSKLKPGMKAALAALVARREAEAYKFARAAVLASPVAISGQHIGGLPGGMPHVADRQVDTHGPNKLPVYATTYAMRDFILDQLDKKISALTTEATQGGEGEDHE